MQCSKSKTFSISKHIRASVYATQGPKIQFTRLILDDAIKSPLNDRSVKPKKSNFLSLNYFTK